MWIACEPRPPLVRGRGDWHFRLFRFVLPKRELREGMGRKERLTRLPHGSRFFHWLKGNGNNCFVGYLVNESFSKTRRKGVWRVQPVDCDSDRGPFTISRKNVPKISYILDIRPGGPYSVDSVLFVESNKRNTIPFIAKTDGSQTNKHIVYHEYFYSKRV